MKYFVAFLILIAPLFQDMGASFDPALDLCRAQKGETLLADAQCTEPEPAIMPLDIFHLPIQERKKRFVPKPLKNSILSNQILS